MGYGLGVFLIARGADPRVRSEGHDQRVDLTMVGWIIARGVLIIVLTAVQANSRRRATSVATTTHSDGTQTVAERRTESDPPPAA